MYGDLPSSLAGLARGRRTARAALLLAVALHLAVLVQAGGTGVYEAVPLNKREQELISTSAEFGTQVARRGYLYTGREMTDLVARIGARLAPEPTDLYLDYRFHVFRDPLPNAFALPDGQIYVNTGMLAILENEAQLAMLLAHEVNHSAGHHTVRNYRSTRKKLIGGMVAGSVVGLGLGNYAPLGGLLTSYVVITSILGYGRDLEEEADRLGIQRAVAAGYDVREGAGLFELLHHDPEGLRFEVATKWSSHPQLLDRAAYLREMAAEIGATQDLDALRVGPEFRDAARDVALVTVGDFMHGGWARSAVALARALTEERPAAASGWLALGDAYRALGAREAYLAEDETTAREKRERRREIAELTRDERDARQRASAAGLSALERNMHHARAFYEHALGLDPDLAEARRGIGLAHLELGEHEEAGRALAVYLKARPEAPDRAVILEHLQAITQALKSRDGGEGDRAGDGRTPPDGRP